MPRPGTLSLPALLALAVPLPAAAPPPEAWDDGIARYALVRPVEGYFVPPAVLKRNFSVPVDKVLRASRRMTAAELDAYTRGGPLKVTRDYPLFVFPNQGTNAFLWKGKPDGEQQVFPRVWDGTHWKPKAYGPRRRVTAVPHLFTLPRTDKKCFVLVYQANGQVGRDRIHTERVAFGAFPGVERVVGDALARADAVVHLPEISARQMKTEWLDCLKGNVFRSELEKVPGLARVSGGSLLFLSGQGAGRKLLFTYRTDDAVFFGPHGELRVPPEARPAKRDLRWQLARQAARPQGDKADCVLRVLPPNPETKGWVVLEMVVGQGSPAQLYSLPVMRHQRDGGNALFSVEVRRGGVRAELVPDGRFGEGSWAAAKPAHHKALGIDYQFIPTGPGLVKVAIRPTTRPWKATAQGKFERAPRPPRRAQDKSPAPACNEVTLNVP